MGDRGNIVILDSTHPHYGQVFLYTHWQGSDLETFAQAALDRAQDRWTDPSYLARVVFNEMTAGDETGTTGFGISATIGDNEHPLLVLDCGQQKAFVVPEAAAFDLFTFLTLNPSRGVPFASFAERGFSPALPLG